MFWELWQIKENSFLESPHLFICIACIMTGDLSSWDKASVFVWCPSLSSHVGGVFEYRAKITQNQCVSSTEFVTV